MNNSKLMTLMTLSTSISMLHAVEENLSIPQSHRTPPSYNNFSSEFTIALSQEKTLENAIAIVIKYYPGYQIRDFFTQIDNKTLDIFRKLAAEEDDASQVRNRILSIFHENLPPLRINEPQTYEMDYTRFLEAILDPTYQYLSPDQQRERKIRQKVEQISADSDDFDRGQITAIEHLNKLNDSIDTLYYETNNAYEYIFNELMRIATIYEDQMSPELAQAAEHIYLSLLSSSHPSPEDLEQDKNPPPRMAGEMIERTNSSFIGLLNYILNNFYMKLKLPLNKRCALALNLILSNTDFAREYLTNVLNQDLIEKPIAPSIASSSNQP